MPEKYEDTIQVQYTIPALCAASKSQVYKLKNIYNLDLANRHFLNHVSKKVRSVSVNECDEPPEKWVKLKSKFDYDLKINFSLDQKELPAVDKENCAELQHISQPESEADNNEEDDD